MEIPSNRIDYEHPKSNMYGCQPCPQCGSKYRVVMAAAPDTIDCDDCGLKQLTEENEDST